MSWDKDRVNRIQRDVITFLTDIFKKEVHSLEDAKQLSDIIASQLNTACILFSIGCGVGLEQARVLVERLRKPPYAV